MHADGVAFHLIEVRRVGADAVEKLAPEQLAHQADGRLRLLTGKTAQSLVKRIPKPARRNAAELQVGTQHLRRKRGRRRRITNEMKRNIAIEKEKTNRKTDGQTERRKRRQTVRNRKKQQGREKQTERKKDDGSKKKMKKKRWKLKRREVN